MIKKDKKSVEHLRISRFRWVIGAPYFVQGTSTLTEIPILYFIKYTLQTGDAGGQLFDALRQSGWFVKPLWGIISDKVAVLGYHRKSWYIIMALAATIFWLLNALLSFVGIRIPLVYLVTFNLAFATYAFVDVVCDALMVTYGRRTERVGSFINFQWAVLALANAGSVYLGGWLQGRIVQDVYEPWLVFLLTGIPPLVTAVVGIRNIEEERRPATRRPSMISRLKRAEIGDHVKQWLGRLRSYPTAFSDFRRSNRPMWLLILFIFFWKFSPSVGYIERSYLIDVRGFTAESFGTILAVGGVTFFVSVLVYAWFVRQFPKTRWHQYLYAMVALGFVAFPAFIIPLTVAGETINVAYAGISYAFLMSLSNATNIFEGVVGAVLYNALSRQPLNHLVQAFGQTFLNIAGAPDERTLILQMFVYISLFFTLLTIPFVELLRRELDRRGVKINLGKRSHAG